MKTPEPGQWQRTSPLAILFFLGKLARDIVRNAWQSIAPLAAFVLTGDVLTRLKIGGAIFAAIVIIISILRYWFFRFQLGDDSILIREGVIKKKQLDIKFDRIQGINTQQNIIFRYFGLVTVNFDTAGSSGDEGNLPAVPRGFADSLRERIGRPLGRAPTEGTDGQPVGRAPTEEASIPNVLLRLGWRDMVRIGLSDKRALIVLAVLGPVLERLGDGADEVIANYVEEAAQGAFQFGVATGIFIVASVVIGIVLLLALISITAAFLRYHNFELFLDGTALRSHGGLLTRHEVSMGLGKIQTLRLQQGIILRLFDRFRMTARQARASHKNDSSKNFTIPIVTTDDAANLRELVLRAEGNGLIQDPSSPSFSPISKYSMRLPFRLLFWMPLAWPFIYLQWRHAGYLYTDEGLVRRSGTIGYRTVALLYRKVQRVSVTRSPLQRRKGLATLRVYMASGSVKLPYIEYDLAQRLCDYILYKVESSRQAWH